MRPEHRMVGASPKRWAPPVTAAALAAALVAGALGCGGSDNRNGVTVPPGGVAIGNLICSVTSTAEGGLVVQGAAILVTFTVEDVNVGPVVGLPVSFEVEGGTLSDPPDATGAGGRVTVTFVADPDFVGPGLVRLIQPNGIQLCQGFTFRIVTDTCQLEAEILNEAGAVVSGFDSCGAAAEDIVRDELRRVVFRVRREDPVTGLLVPVEGARVLATLTGFTSTSLVSGPTDADGEVELGDTDGDGAVDVPVVVRDSATGRVAIRAEVVVEDVDGDTVPDGFACEGCEVAFDVSNVPCAQDGDVLAVQYWDAFGAPTTAPLKPGQSATVTATLELDGAPLANESVVVSAANGSVSAPATTDADGMITVTYVPNQGFSGTDTILIRAARTGLDCAITADVDVVTCELTVDLDPDDVVAGSSNEVTFTISNVDPASAAGARAALSSSGGFFTPPGPTIETLMAAGPDSVTVMGTYNATVDYEGPGSVSVSFIDNRPPCGTQTGFFTVEPAP